MSYNEERKPHAVLTPYPVQGHVNPLLKLAKLLHLRGFYITFVHTEYNYKRLLKSRGPNALDGLPDFRFVSIPDGLPPLDDANVTQHVPSLCDSIRKNFLKPYCNLVRSLNHSATEHGGTIPPVTCLVSDGCMPFTIQAAQQLGLPNLIFWPASACSFLSIINFPTLVEKGLTPLKDESYLRNGYLNSKVDWIPGMKNFRLKDIPDFIRTTDLNDVMLQFFIEVANKVQRNSTILFNTFDELEGDVMNALSSMFPSLYPIGPFPLLLNQSPQSHLASLGSNLWKEDPECLEWLESKESGSVVYVNFGSITVMSAEQLLEFAWGLANSKKPFLWIIRPDLVIGGSVILSSEFVNETRDRSLIASWCPQEQVLNHPSICGFLTHCGWNSTTESVCAGVPMLCWPFFADQPTNCRYICNEWEIGIQIDTNVKREEVEKLVSELMVGEKGKKMREKTMGLKKKAEEATRPSGCSYMNLDKKRLRKSRGPNALDGLPNFRFETIPDGLPPLDDDDNGLIPPVTCLVSDGGMTFTIEAAHELGVPNVLFWPASACCFLSIINFPALVEKGLTPLKVANKVQRNSTILFNTFDELEGDVMNALSSMFPSLYPIGPFPLLLNQSPQSHLESLGSVILPSEFVNETKDRSLLIASWCPQEQVLNHPSICGVPMLCWPFYGDQPKNCKYICSEWEIGIEIDTNVKREDVEKLVNELMVGEKGKKMREKTMELKKKAEEATRPSGNSYMNLDKVSKEVLLNWTGQGALHL
ncbi:hypothetical protein JHK84_041733 [Glycine max]|nr:hypothetical protein JHK86_041523 [Glycine max]KAG4955750.1 hypothetical protein JHK85_042130 [Glycine max]KAG5115620.1 hypothetical protein JHK84_041733 [Glycine max]